jgi:FkbM family methyltransferase
MYHSQFQQDKYLEENIFKGYKFGIFVDIGSHDGLEINNTLYFEKNNRWNGFNVEPIKEVYDKLVINRPNCINLNYAVSNNDGVSDFIYNKGYSEMISGLVSEYDSRHLNRLKNEQNKMGGSTDIIKMETKKFSTMCKENNIKYINYLSIDVEGAEFSVIKSIDFEEVFIDVIGFENNYKDTSTPIIDYLRTKGYILLLNDADIFMVHMYSKFNKK